MREHASALAALHVPGAPLLLPNAWDADTARLVEDAGFPAVATSSIAVAAALGYSDGEAAPADQMLAAAARIARVVSVPVTVDAEAGHGLPPAELVRRLLDAGVAGCNIEDTDHAGGGLVDPSEQADRLAEIKQAAGDALVLNARVDSFIGARDEAAVLPDALDRARRYLRAGADCVYPALATSAKVLESFTGELAPAPVNVTYLPAGPSLADATSFGVARVSLGGGLWQAGQSWLRDRLAEIAAGRMPY